MRLLTGVLKMLVVISAPAYCTVRGIATCIEINLGRAFHFQSIGYYTMSVPASGFHASA
jgi:hypothetical protein